MTRAHGSHDPAIVEDECRCACHRSVEAVKHVRPCCEPCPRCGRRIPIGVLSRHLARQHPDLRESATR